MNVNGNFIGGPPSNDDVDRLAANGVKTVIDLREPKEIEPSHRDSITNHGMQYVNIPVSKTTFSDEKVEQFARSLKETPGAHLLHCASGARAGAMMIMVHATAARLSSGEALKMAESLGFDCDAHPEIKAFFCDYIDRHKASAAKT